MDQLASHIKHKHFYKIKRFFSLLGLGVIFLVVACLIQLIDFFSKNIAFLNSNSGAVSLLLTSVIVIITGYYTYITNKLLTNEKKRRISEIKPIVTFNIDPFVHIPCDDSDKSQEVRLKFDINYSLKNYNGIAINFDQSYSMPHSYEYREDLKKEYGKVLTFLKYYYELLFLRYRPINLGKDFEKNPYDFNYINYTSGTVKTIISELEKDKVYSNSVNFFTHNLYISEQSDLSYQKTKVYFIVDLIYQDIDQNNYFHKIFFTLWKEVNYESNEKKIRLKKVYEEIDFVEHNKMKYDRFFDRHNFSQTLMKKKYWG